MQQCQVYRWVQRAGRRRLALQALKQPTTPTQLAMHTPFNSDDTSAVLSDLTRHHLTVCLNPQAARCRVYGLTPLGVATRAHLQAERDLPATPYHQPHANWNTYGKCCQAHRAAIITALDGPLTPPQIRRAARYHNPELRMSANNTRDALYTLTTLTVTTPVPLRRRAYPAYTLTAQGEIIKALLLRAKTP